MGGLPEYQRVISVGANFVTRNGGDAVLSSVELWHDRVKLHFAYSHHDPPMQDSDGRRRLGPGWLLSDDVGTHYKPSGGGAGGSDVMFGYASFTPSRPLNAALLLVSSPELAEPIEVPL